MAALAVSTAGDGRYDRETAFLGWAGFYGITGHTRDHVFSTEDAGVPAPLRVLADAPDRVALAVGPVRVCGFEYTWTFELDEDSLWVEPGLYVAEPVYTDNEVYLFAFDCRDDEIQEFYTDAGFISPPKRWFARPWPVINYRGNFDRSNYDLLHRWRFPGMNHDWIVLHFAGFGLRLEKERGLASREACSFKVLRTELLGEPEPGTVPYAFRSLQTFGIGTPFESERRQWMRWERYGCRVRFSYVKPAPLVTLELETGDERFDELTKRFHRTHAHTTQHHKWGYCGGAHGVGTGFPGIDSFGKKREYLDNSIRDGVTFEYFMHSPAHLVGVWPGTDDHMRWAVESALDVTFADGMIYGGHRLGKRGMFYETNASMLCFFADYVKRSGDVSLYPRVKVWAEYLERHTDERPRLFRTPGSTGVPGPGGGGYVSNWFDTHCIGGYDGYANALYYGALVQLAKIAQRAGDEGGARHYAELAGQVREGFNEALWNPETGRYAGWRDARGRLHDAFYTFVNLLACYFGIAEERRAREIVEAIDRKVAELGYKGHSLPCNLEPVPEEDYSGGEWWRQTYGYYHQYDRFGVYLNGGIWAWISCPYIAVKGRWDPEGAYRHFLRILEQYEVDELFGAGNGYFWDTATGELLAGSREEPYLANIAMSIYGLYTLFGVEVDILEGVALRPRLPRQMADAKIGLYYKGKKLRFVYHGYGRVLERLLLDGRELPGDRLPEDALRDGSVIDVYVREGGS